MWLCRSTNDCRRRTYKTNCQDYFVSSYSVIARGKRIYLRFDGKFAFPCLAGELGVWRIFDYVKVFVFSCPHTQVSVLLSVLVLKYANCSKIFTGSLFHQWFHMKILSAFFFCLSASRWLLPWWGLIQKDVCHVAIVKINKVIMRTKHCIL